MSIFKKVITASECDQLAGKKAGTTATRLSRGSYHETHPDDVRKAGRIWLMTTDFARWLYAPNEHANVVCPICGGSNIVWMDDGEKHGDKAGYECHECREYFTI